MNKTDLIFNISQKTGLPKTTCREIIDLVLDCVIERLIAGERVTLSNFGAFSVAGKMARSGVNPRTKERIVIPPHRVIKFRAGNELEKQLNPSDN
jgi:DNA-binding protein HU-beta